ncbi:hypothetical protein ACIRPR_33875 [Streptomyces griseoflavus]|uniref:hypothetical protein n=1 Tax=Streptomyces griseoflavus TaxID=35619 RepID=UPI00381161E6
MLITPDPAAPEGKAIIDLAATMDALQGRTGEWPGADTVDILGDWLSRFTFATSTVLPRQVTGRAWVLRRWDRHSDEATLWSDEASALAELAEHVRSSWDNVAGTDGVPHRPPVDDQRAVDLYYGPKEHRGDEDYALFVEDIARYAHTPRSLSLADDTACAQANSAAVFHPMTGPDDEGLPCIELAGILVFVYLDPHLGAVRVSVHLDTAAQQLVRPDHTVPLQVEVENATVFNTLGSRPAPARVPRWKVRLRRLADRTARHDARGRRQGG